MNKKVIIITGASSGMGKEAARLLAKQGHTVYAGARRVEKMNDLKQLGIKPMKLDVTRDDMIAEFVHKVIKQEGCIDILINNAGFGLFGSVEDIPLDEARYQFDVNMFGLAAMTKQVIPYMRRQNSGRIVNISSIGGKIYTPFGSWYHATKHAMEGWSDCLRYELKPFGIDVIIVEPGLVRTDFENVTAKALRKYAEGSPYKKQIEPYFAMLNSPGMTRFESEASVLGKTIAKAATTSSPKIRYVKGAGAWPLLLFRRLFGDHIYDWGISKIMG